MNYIYNKLSKPSVDETSRIGMKWSYEENDELLQDMEYIKDINKIASKHKRTPCAIESRIMYHIVFPLYKDRIYENIQEISEYYNLDCNTIKKYAERIYKQNDILCYENTIYKTKKNVKMKEEILCEYYLAKNKILELNKILNDYIIKLR
jgi:hypothetical protein